MMPLPTRRIKSEIPLTVITILLIVGSSTTKVFSAIQAFTLDRTAVTLAVGDSVEVKVTFTDTSTTATPTEVSWQGGEGFVEITKTATGATIKAIKVTDSISILAVHGTDTQALNITIKPKVEQVRFSEQLFRADDTEKLITLVEGDEIPVVITLPSGGPIPVSVKLESANTEFVTVINTTLPRLVKAQKAFSTPIVVNVKSDEVVINSFKVKVSERISEISPNRPVVTKSQDEYRSSTPPNVIPFSDLDVMAKGIHGGTFSANNLSFQPQTSNIVRVRDNGLEIVGAGDVVIEVTPKPVSTAGATSTSPRVKSTLTLSIKAAAESIVIQPNFTSIEVNKTQDITATTLDKEGKPTDVNITWELAEADKQYVRIMNQPLKNTIRVLAIKKGGPVQIKAKAGQKEESAYVLATQRGVVSRYKPISVRLDLMDDQMARDLYGKKTLDEFYATKVRIFNNMTDDQGSSTGDSILVFSESMEVGVSLEKKPTGGGKWTCLTKDDVQIIRSSLGLENFNFAGDPRDDDEGDRAKQIRESREQSSPGCVEATARPGSDGVVHTPDGDRYRVQFPIPYRPYTFEMVANTHDRRDERSLRNRLLLGMNILGSATSFVTSIWVPKSSSDLPVGLDKYKNLFIPGFERLFPSLREVQRQNIISQVMKAIEEVPSGSDISRVLFFPKREMSGVLPGYKVRINGISTYELRVQVGVVKKTDVEQQ